MTYGCYCWSKPRTKFDMGTFNAFEMRMSVFIVMGLPASICCQCRVAKSWRIMSS